MAIKYAQASGNYSTTTWYDAASGGSPVDAPGDGDEVRLNGFTVAMDVTPIPASGTLLSLNSKNGAGEATAGKLTIDLQTLAADAVINAAELASGTVAFIELTGSALSYTLTVNGNVVGGSAVNAYGISHSSTGGVVVNGNVTGGSGANSNGLRGLSSGATTINGNVTGGSASTATGVTMPSVGPVTIIGDVTGGTHASAYGAYNLGAYDKLNITGKLVNSQNSSAVSGPCLYTPADSDYVQHVTTGAAAFKMPKQLAATNIKDGVVHGDITGNRTDPDVADVMDGVTYGAAGAEFEGTMALATGAQLNAAQAAIQSGVNVTQWMGETPGSLFPLIEPPSNLNDAPYGSTLEFGFLTRNPFTGVIENPVGDVPPFVMFYGEDDEEIEFQIITQWLEASGYWKVSVVLDGTMGETWEGFAPGGLYYAKITVLWGTFGEEIQEDVVLGPFRVLAAEAAAGVPSVALSTASTASVVAAIEAGIIDDETGEAVKAAIIASMAAYFPDLDELTVSAFAAASAIATRDAILDRVLAGNHDTTGTVGKLLQKLNVTGEVANTENAASFKAAMPTVEEIREEIDANSTKLAAIVEDTGTTIPGAIAGVSNPVNVTIETKEITIE